MNTLMLTIISILLAGWETVMVVGQSPQPDEECIFQKTKWKGKWYFTNYADCNADAAECSECVSHNEYLAGDDYPKLCSFAKGKIYWCNTGFARANALIIVLVIFASMCSALCGPVLLCFCCGWCGFAAGAGAGMASSNTSEDPVVVVVNEKDPEEHSEQ